MTYTIAQILAAAEAAEVSMIDAQHICDTLVKMNEKLEIGTFRKMLQYDYPFKPNEIVKIIRINSYGNPVVENIKGKVEVVNRFTHEPTTETF